MAAAFVAAPLDARVPTCPDFTLADLAAHVGEFTGLWTHVLCEAGEQRRPRTPPSAASDDPSAWYLSLADHLVDQLRSTAGDAPCWMWIPDHQTAGTVARRCANELSIHRYDAQTASGTMTPLDPAVALDAIEEIFVMLPAWDNPPEGSGRTLGLRASDGDQRAITLGAEGPRLHLGPREADLTLTGTASDLALLLFERPPIGPVQEEGDPATLAAWYREFRFD